MTLAPLATGPHLVPANRLAFTTPVREASSGGRWVTLHAEDSDEGTCHVFIGGGSGPGSGTITKGPKGLLHQHIAALASHPSVSKAQHHPVGHEPKGARDHPHYAEAPPNAERRTPNAGPQEEPAKRAGKPYARLSGAEQGTRAEQITKALSEAQSAAKGAKAAQGQDKTATGAAPQQGKPASPQTETEEAPGKKGTFGERREATVKRMQEKASRRGTPYRVLGVSDDVTTCEICGKADLKRTVALHDEVSGVVRAGSDCAAELLRTSRASIEKAARQHGEKREEAIQKALESHPNQEIIKRFAGQIQRMTAYHRGQKTTPSESDQQRMAFARQRMADLTAEARRDVEKQLPADKPLPQSEVEQRVVHGRTLRTEKPAIPFSAPNAERQTSNAIADTAVAHQQAQADLAAHRAKADRNPNPWAPHLSPPVGDAKDRELAEKATRAQLAHQAAQAQQQGEAQAEQTEGQRAHEKEMVRLKQGAGGRGQATEKPAVNPSHARKLDLTPAERAQIEAERKPEPNPPEPLRATPPKQSNLLREKASPSGKRRVSLEMPTPRSAAPGPQGTSTPAPEQPAAAAPASPQQATPAHAAHEDTLQHLRDHVVARNPVGHSVSPAHVLREMPGATRQEAIAHLDALAQRGVLRQNQHHANFYEVQPGHGASGPGKGDAPAADIRHAQAQQTAPQPEQLAGAPSRRDEPIVMADGGTRTRQQYDLAAGMGRDAANARMRSEGRTTWNEDDYNHHVKTMNDFLERDLHLHQGPAAERARRKAAKARESAIRAPRFSAPAAR